MPKLYRGDVNDVEILVRDVERFTATQAFGGPDGDFDRRHAGRLVWHTTRALAKQDLIHGIKDKQGELADALQIAKGL